MSRHNWRETPKNQRWCAKCQDFRPLEMFAFLPSRNQHDNYCEYHRREARRLSKRKYQKPKPLMVTCPNCKAKFNAKA